MLARSLCTHVIGFLNSNNNVEDFKTEGNYLTTFNKSKKSLKRSSNRPDLLLYNINIINHIINDKKWFKDDYIFNKGQLKTLKTGRGLIISKGNNTAVFIILSQVNPLKYYKVIFKDVLYLLNIDVNLFNDLKHYKSGGYLEKNKLYTF